MLGGGVQTINGLIGLDDGRPPPLKKPALNTFTCRLLIAAKDEHCQV
jgi:hypothetical protein